MNEIFFVSGLPRSGSTLLMNILGQHPDVYITPTSGCHEVLWGLRNNWSQYVEHKADKQGSATHNLQRVLKSVLNSYHDTDKPVVFDKHRSWLHSIELIEFILQRKAKIIVPVRSIVDILSSFEKLYRKTAHLTPPPGQFSDSQTTAGRLYHWSSNAGELGIAFNRLKDAFQRGYGDRLILVEYEALTTNPDSVMKQLWTHLGLSPANHDFTNVKQITFEDESFHIYGPDLHTIRPQITYTPSDAVEILGVDNINKYKYQEFWRSNNK